MALNLLQRIYIQNCKENDVKIHESAKVFGYMDDQFLTYFDFSRPIKTMKSIFSTKKLNIDYPYNLNI